MEYVLHCRYMYIKAKCKKVAGAVVKPGTMEMETEMEMEMEMEIEMEMQVCNGSSLVPRPPPAFFEFMKWGRGYNSRASGLWTSPWGRKKPTLDIALGLSG